MIYRYGVISFSSVVVMATFKSLTFTAMLCGALSPPPREIRKLPQTMKGTPYSCPRTRLPLWIQSNTSDTSITSGRRCRKPRLTSVERTTPS